MSFIANLRVTLFVLAFFIGHCAHAQINFGQVALFDGVTVDVLDKPTSIAFGPDGRLYVSEQDGTINAFSIALQGDIYVPTSHEVLQMANGQQVVKSMQNYDDDGALHNVQERLVTGIALGGTAANPVIYISSSDYRFGKNEDVNLDTNSGVITRATWNGSSWDAVDIVRGIPRSEEIHANNGLVLDEENGKLYTVIGGTTNNGAPSLSFGYTAEYALMSVFLELDLNALNAMGVKSDNSPGQNGRQYIYDLPTLDDPNTPNNNDGVGEDANGMDEDGPWGGLDGLNQAVLPADAPIRIVADGLRNPYDVVKTQNGHFYTLDNGGNAGFGGDPIIENGIATNLPNNGGDNDPEPLFRLEESGYYGHPVPIRAVQNQSWTVYDNEANPDASVAINFVPDISALVPDVLDIQDGFLIDPSKFTGDSERLAQSAVRIQRDSSASNTLVNIGSSSNGLTEYTGGAFDGALDGALLVTQFNGNVTALNVNDTGTGLEPLVDPGSDNVLGTADDSVLSQSGVHSVITGLSTPLDVTNGPNGTVWVAVFGSNQIAAYGPNASGNLDGVSNTPDDVDADDLANAVDPFQRDASNGADAVLVAGMLLDWDFDTNGDNNLVGPNGFGGGLTGVMVNGSTDFEAFFQQDSSVAGQILNLDNIKFTTAAGGGTTVVENVSSGDPINGFNSGTYLFQTGATIGDSVDSFNAEWDVFNPGSAIVASNQQLGGYIGTGDQSNYIKFVAQQFSSGGHGFAVLMEENDSVQHVESVIVPDIFTAEPNSRIFFTLQVDRTNQTITPVVSYELTVNGPRTELSLQPFSIAGSNTLAAINQQFSVQGQQTGMALGLFSGNFRNGSDNSFSATFDAMRLNASASDAGDGSGGTDSPDAEIIGNDITNPGSNLDSWASNMVIDESNIFTNATGQALSINVSNFSFHADNNLAPITPFVVKVNGDNDFTVMAIGSTRTGYSLGANTVAFSDGDAVSITLQDGESLAAGFLDANADGSDSTGSVVPFESGSNEAEIWYSGGALVSESAALALNQAPIRGVRLITSLRRTYAFQITFEPSDPTPAPEPTPTPTPAPTPAPAPTPTPEPTPAPDAELIGNDITNPGSNLDSWASNMVIDESNIFTNVTGQALSINVSSFSFHADSNAAPITPFVTKVNGDNDFTVMAIGSTRTGYSLGANTVAFSDGGAVSITLQDGESIAAGFLDANADGSNSTGSVVPFESGSNEAEIWYSGGALVSESGALAPNQAPIRGVRVITALRRTYAFQIIFDLQ